MLYLLNTAVLPLREGKTYIIKAKQLTIEEAKELVHKEPFISAIGHQATATLLSNVLNADIKFNRIAITLDDGDKALAFTLKKRLEEGKIIKDVKELEEIGYSFWLFEIHSENNS